MQLGMIGLGRMGSNMAARIRNAGHEVIGYDADASRSEVADLPALVAALDAPRAVWVMLPAGPITQGVLTELAGLLEPGDVVVEGGNSRFSDDAANAAMLAEHGIGYLDCGVSGGVWGLDNGYGLMAGGDEASVARLMPIFDALRPEGPREEGFVHAGGVGAGHYAKMVHNGIEYGLMHAYAEGWELLEASDVVSDVKGCFKAWSRGTVVRSWLLDLAVSALEESPHLDGISEYTTDSGEGRWTLDEAVEHAVPMPVLAAALFARYSSRQENSPTMRMVSALRGQFGGHTVERTGE
ncbi:MAG: decarboxylating 6-phosphogluconate dehydrogenase [Propioniciclava sp.]|uniref:phosphogluconate dehydrogenase (NAD(+)-dependent, decarboxylating) n=1 Tax=Propioniciclava sp. TaxID=2038686 RepID=UPI0039E4C86A